MYNEKYLEAKDSYDWGYVELALEEFKSFIAQNNHPINGMELTNSYRYIAKIYYELDNYQMSLKYWNLKSTRSAFTWKDFYSRALSAIFCSYYSIKDGNYILIKEDAKHHGYNVLDIWLDLEITQKLVEEKIAVKRPINFSLKQKKATNFSVNGFLSSGGRNDLRALLLGRT